MAIELGMACTVEATVDDDMLASAVGSGTVDVLATPVMIAQMELAASLCIAPALEEGQASVGTLVHVEHLAASPVGAHIFTTATVTAVDGRRVDFKVVAEDAAGEIGHGTHTRFVVDTSRFMEKANSRV